MPSRYRMTGTKAWWIAFSLSSSLVVLFCVALYELFSKGVGIWGINIPNAWGFAITNFVWWVGIGHAGTFISAILYLARQEWRTAISRFAETMTIFAVVCAGLFPLLHLGRPFFFYWLAPYPSTFRVWPQFRSPLVWDMFAVLTYLTVSVLFWFLGLVPDFAMERDAAKNPLVRKLYAFFALGWRGSLAHWQQYKILYLLLAGLATPLVISVHSIVGLDFATAILPGWHSTIFPPYFVAGAIFSGFAMVLTIGILLRQQLHLEDLVTLDHIENCAKFMLAMGCIVSYGYAVEAFMANYSGDAYEIRTMKLRFFGPYWLASWTMILCNVVLPQILWWKKARRSTLLLFPLSILVNVGMWLERYVIIISSLSRDFLPSSWHEFTPTFWDFATFFGTIGVFATLYLLFIRVAPIIAVTEIREEEAAR